MKRLAIVFCCSLMVYVPFCALHMNLDAEAASNSCFLEGDIEAIEMTPGSALKAVETFFKQKGWNEG